MLGNANGDISREMILRLNRVYKGRGKLVRASEILAGARWGGF